MLRRRSDEFNTAALMGFEPPRLQQRLEAIGPTNGLSAMLQRAFGPGDSFEPVPGPGPSDWLTIVIATVYERTAKKYKGRADRYVHMEVGHAAQNVHLQAVALELGTVVVGAFDDAEVKEVLALGTDEEPLCLMPVGKPRW